MLMKLDRPIWEDPHHSEAEAEASELLCSRSSMAGGQVQNTFSAEGLGLKALGWP